MFFKPTKLGSARESAIEPQIDRRGQIERSPGVVLAAAWRGDKAQDPRDSLAVCQLGPDQAGLPRDAAKAGNREQDAAVVRRRHAHFPPRGRGSRREFQPSAAVGREANGNESFGLPLQGQAARGGVIGGDAEFRPNPLQ